MEMDKIDSKFKRKRDKDTKMQRMYSAYEKQVDDKALERFRERPYQLKLAERMKNNGIEEQRREPS